MIAIKNILIIINGICFFLTGCSLFCFFASKGKTEKYAFLATVILLYIWLMLSSICFYILYSQIQGG